MFAKLFFDLSNPIHCLKVYFAWDSNRKHICNRFNHRKADTNKYRTPHTFVVRFFDMLSIVENRKNRFNRKESNLFVRKMMSLTSCGVSKSVVVS